MKIQIAKVLSARTILFPLVLLFSSFSIAEVSVIAHPSVSETVAAGDVERLYLGKTKSLPGGTNVVPINLESGNAVRDEFNDKALGKTDSQLKSYWSRLVFTGKAQPPKDVASESEVINLVKSNPNMIGYVSSGSVTGDVKVIATF